MTMKPEVSLEWHNQIDGHYRGNNGSEEVRPPRRDPYVGVAGSENLANSIIPSVINPMRTLFVLLLIIVVTSAFSKVLWDF